MLLQTPSNIILVVALYTAGSVFGAGRHDYSAIHQCAKRHTHTFENKTNIGGEYANQNCQLRCYIDDKLVALDPINEGLACLDEHKAGVSIWCLLEKNRESVVYIGISFVLEM